MKARKMSVAKVLKCSIDKINAGKWGAGTLYRNESKGVPVEEFCAIGLVSNCLLGGHRTSYVESLDGANLIVAAATVEALYAALPAARRARKRKECEVATDAEVSLFHKEDAVVSYNDRSNPRTMKSRTSSKSVRILFERALASVS